MELYAPQVDRLVKDGLVEVTDDAITIARKARAYDVRFQTCDPM